jgi:hypothetical protein
VETIVAHQTEQNQIGMEIAHLLGLLGMMGPQFGQPGGVIIGPIVRGAGGGVGDLQGLLARTFAEANHPTRNPLSAEELDRLARTEIEFSSLSEEVRIQQPMCLISQESFEDRSRVIVLPVCGHVFGASSILRWMGENRTCPLCRRDVDPERESESRSPPAGGRGVPPTT